MLLNILSKKAHKQYFFSYPCHNTQPKYTMKTTGNNFILSLLFAFTVALSIVSCNDPKTQQPTEADIATESAKLNEWFDAVWDSAVSRYPTWETYLGIRDESYGDWSDNSDSNALKELQITKDDLAYLRENFDTNLLDEQTLVSYHLWMNSAEKDIREFEYRLYDYPVNQMHGTHTWIPSFLMNMHTVDNVEQAEAYISRVDKVPHVIDQLLVNMKDREEAQIVPPKFVFPMVLGDCRNIITGKPFDDSNKDAALLADFKRKVDGLEDVDSTTKADLVARLETKLTERFKPAYESLIAYLEEQEKTATTDDGVWKFPNGDKYYDVELANYTTTQMTAEEIFKLGMSEVKRIHQEMEKIKEQVGFEGTLQEFFTFIEEDPQFYYPNDSAGKAAYLARSIEVIDSMRAFLPNFFGILPKADLEVQPVEAYREKSAGIAFYQDPAPDGSRPGRYYVNLYDMAIMPKYEIEALAYHEGIPGHHMQLSIAQELTGLPKFRTLGGNYTAYTEGWGLYSEYIPKEYGFYSDPYSDFGRLSMELWRACRLVVDVGIHYKRWTRQEGIDFYTANTPSPADDCRKMVERHIVYPGQATAYKIGQLKILSLLDKAKTQLGDKFDIRAFHDEVLKYGALPLNVLEQNIDKWIASYKTAEM